MDITNGSPKTNNRASAFVVDYDATEGARMRASTPRPRAKPDIEFYVPTPHRSALVVAGAEERPRSGFRGSVSRLLRRA